MPVYEFGVNHCPKGCLKCELLKIEDHGIAGIFYCVRTSNKCPKGVLEKGLKHEV